MEPALQGYLNKQWKSTCRIVLGEEIGELNEYAKWLYEGNGPRITKKSIVSGNDVVFASQNYPEKSKWIGHDEVIFDKKYESFNSLDVNEIKDIDSIIRAVSERVAYTGNIVLGNSKFVEDSTAITDCFYVLHSERVAYAKNIAYSTRGGYSENIFGCYGFGPISFAIKSYGITESSRLFMVSKADFCSDIYYSHGLTGCTECMFSFNLKSKRNAIGNCVLSKGQYALLKKKLIAEIVDLLKRNKRLPSIAEIAGKTRPKPEALKTALSGKVNAPKEEGDRSHIEKAFSHTTAVLFGKALGPIDDYAKWLSKCSDIRSDNAKSCLSGAAIFVPDYAGFIDYPRDRLLTQEEANVFGELHTIRNVELLSFANAAERLGDIAYFSPFWLAGNLKNNIDSPLNIDSVNCYGGVLYIRSKLSAFCFSPRSCDYTFGSREGRHCSFTINCHFSARLTRCFEVDSSNDCSDCYFCHNCENVHESMFCFNIRNKRYAIGNVELGKERYLKAKKALQEWILKELETKGELGYNIFNVGTSR